MTDQRASARAMIENWFVRSSGKTSVAFSDQDDLEELIATALADAERRGLERAAKVMCPFCNDPEWVTCNPDGDHISPHTGNTFICQAWKIREAQAQVEKEG